MNLRLPGAHASGQGGIAREVDPFLHGQHAGQGQFEEFVAPAELATGPQRFVTQFKILDAAYAGSGQGVGDANAHLVVTGIGRFVAEQDEVEGTLVLFQLAHGRDDGPGRGDGVPFTAVGLEMNQLCGPYRRGVTQLFGRLRWTERQHRDRSTVLLHDAHRFFHGALLVRANGEAQLAGVDLLAVGVNHDLGADHGDAFDADENVHPV